MSFPRVWRSAVVMLSVAVAVAAGEDVSGGVGAGGVGW